MVTTTSTPVEQQITPENRVILKGVSWSTFKALLTDVGDDRAWRIAYDRGVLEIRMPLEEHEEPKRLIESFVETIVDELEIELRSSDYTNSSINKDAIYAALGVPELWRYRRQSLQVYQLVEGEYQKCDRSLAFPFLPIAEIPGFIEQSRTIGQRATVRLFRQRIREMLVEI